MDLPLRRERARTSLSQAGDRCSGGRSRDPYEEPESAEIVCHTGDEDVETSKNKVLGYLKENGILG